MAPWNLLLVTVVWGIVLPSAAASASAAMREFFVAPDGNDRWSGTRAQPAGDGKDGPFLTLERARDNVRTLAKGKPTDSGVVIWIRGGVYPRWHSFELTAVDGGTPERPVVYRAYRDESPRLVGGQAVRDFSPVTDPAILARIDPIAREHVVQTNLKAQGIHDFGRLTPRGMHRLMQPAPMEVFFKGRPMQLARWPKVGFAEIATAPEGPDGGRFTYSGDRPSRWLKAPDVWLHGYWMQDWADSYAKVASIDPATRTITTEPPHGVYGYAPGRRWYALNILEELDQPGEYYIDRKSGVLYFWPPEPIAEEDVVVSILEEPMLVVRGASNLTIQGLTFQAGRGPGAVIVGCSHDRIAGCTFRNLGMFAVSFGDHWDNYEDDLYTDTLLDRDAGTDNQIIGCDIYATGEGGIYLGGGDRRTLARGDNAAINNHIYDFNRWVRTYRPAISIDGVGNRVSHNLIHDAPHAGILLHGNDHVIDLNELHHVCEETSDCGAIYMGRDLSERGNVVRFNFIHDLGRNIDVNAIYLDDLASGAVVYGNICARTGRGVLLGGGHDDAIENNVFVDCSPAILVDARGVTWARKFFNGADPILMTRLDAIREDQPPYSRRYPQLADIRKNKPDVPSGDIIVRNICIGSWLELASELRPQQLLVSNNFTEGDPMFVAPSQLDFHLKPQSPALRTGFRPIPIEKIGLEKDAWHSRPRL